MLVEELDVAYGWKLPQWRERGTSLRKEQGQKAPLQELFPEVRCYDEPNLRTRHEKEKVFSSSCCDSAFSPDHGEVVEESQRKRAEGRSAWKLCSEGGVSSRSPLGSNFAVLKPCGRAAINLQLKGGLHCPKSFTPQATFSACP